MRKTLGLRKYPFQRQCLRMGPGRENQALSSRSFTNASETFNSCTQFSSEHLSQIRGRIDSHQCRASPPRVKLWGGALSCWHSHFLCGVSRLGCGDLAASRFAVFSSTFGSHDDLPNGDYEQMCHLLLADHSILDCPGLLSEHMVAKHP